MPANLQMIDREIRSGLSNEKPKLDAARMHLDFYHGRFDSYPTREENMYHDRSDHRRTSRIMARVIGVLTESIYKKPPTRTVAAGSDASDWLARVYKRSDMQDVWPEADALSLVADVAALQFTGTDDPEAPVEAQLWEADSFLVWTEPGRPRVPAAVATVDRFDNQSRLRLWTAEVMRTYLTEKLGPGQTAGGQAWHYQGEEPNPYGVLPFSFVHAKRPTIDFHCSHGLGSFLSQLNDNLNFIMDNLGDAVRFTIYPIGVALGTSPTWSPPSKMKPGTFLSIPGAVGNAGSNVLSNPTLDFITPPVGYVEVVWTDLNSYLDRCLEDAGIPPGTIRMEGGAESGVAILIETGPLLKWAANRRQAFVGFESDAAQVAAKVAAAHLEGNRFPVPPFLVEMAKDPGLSIRWAPLYVELPGIERDRSDEWLLRMGLSDKVEVLMSRYELTEDEAFDRLLKILERNARLRALGIDPDVGLIAPPLSDGPDGGSVANSLPDPAAE